MARARTPSACRRNETALETAWLGEWWVWMFALAVAFFAATLDRRTPYIFIAVILVYYVVRIAQRRRRTKAA